MASEWNQSQGTRNKGDMTERLLKHRKKPVLKEELLGMWEKEQKVLKQKTLDVHLTLLGEEQFMMFRWNT